MLSHLKHVTKASDLLRVLAMIGLFLALTVSARAESCTDLQLDVPDADSLNLQDGDHVIASAPTEKGKLEVRVKVAGKKASEPEYYLGGKLLKKTPESKVPEDILKCLKPKVPKGASLSSAETPSENFASSLCESTESVASSAFDWLEGTAHAAASKCVIKSASCNQNTCCALACCGTSCSVACVGY
jgi:hypothetical protein